MFLSVKSYLWYIYSLLPISGTSSCLFISIVRVLFCHSLKPQISDCFVVLAHCLYVCIFFIFTLTHVFVNCSICRPPCLLSFCSSSERGCSLLTWRLRPSWKSRLLSWKRPVSNVSIWSFRSSSTQSGSAPTRYCECPASPDSAVTQAVGKHGFGKGNAVTEH